ncbi:MAG: T9SS type A sorting domain-containing protein [Chitinophagaceae bacterium]|nr:T9SS type A sorting domain-containing protein [Chitinophagaceae bacterium]
MHKLNPLPIRLALVLVLLAGIPCTGTAQVVSSVSASVFNDANGNVTKDGSEPGLGTTGSSRLYVYIVRNSTTLIVDSAHIPSSGLSKSMSLISGPSYTISLSTVQYAIGTNVSSTPIDRTLPSGWYHTGERRGTAASADATPDGAFTFSGLGTSPFWFGIQRGPAADAKAYLVSNTAFSTTPPAGFPDISSPSDPWMLIPMNDPALSGYTTSGSLSGSDPEDCPLASSCNTGTGTTFMIDSLYDDTRLFYDFGGTTGVQEVDLSSGPFAIADFRVNNMVIWGRKGAGATGRELGFTYALRDAAGTSGTAVAYTITTTAPLPVALLHFNASGSGQQVVLDWATASEQNNKGFEIERSTDARHWSSQGFISSKSTQGKSNIRLNYTYSDQTPEQGRNLYRLKQVDYDGRMTHSPVRVVHLSPGSQVCLFPNPASEQLFISNMQGVEQIAVYDANGRLLYRQKAAGDNAIIPFQHMNKGTYYIHLIRENGAALHTIMKQ